MLGIYSLLIKGLYVLSLLLPYQRYQLYYLYLSTVVLSEPKLGALYNSVTENLT